MSKNQLNFRFIFLAFLSTFLFIGVGQNIYAQNVKKNKVRLKAEYVKIMDGEVYFDIKAISKVKKQNINVSNIELIIYNVLQDEQIELGNITTNTKGESRFILKKFNTIKPDSTNTYNISILFKGNDFYSKASKSISFKNADIAAKIITIHGINSITASLTETGLDRAITDELLKVQVQRLFKPLIIGDEFNRTDKNGAITIPVPEGIPGIDGNLALEVILDESDEFGTVKAIVNARVGTPIVEESTFDQRTMWSPPSKTPIFLLIFPNLIILGIWLTILLLIINLFKISKSKN